MESQIKRPPDLWSLEHPLTKRRKEINLRYDFDARIPRTYLANFCKKDAGLKKIWVVWKKTTEIDLPFLRNSGRR
jgi:hypothetical protein